MTTTTEANKTNENSAILRELDELMEYMDTDDSQETEELIDPSFFIGTMDVGEEIPDVPTLTTVAKEAVAVTETKQQQDEAEAARQPGLFSARVERLKQQEKAAAEPSNTVDAQQHPENQDLPEELAVMVDQLVAENMPKIEAQLRDKITAYLQGRKNS